MQVVPAGLRAQALVPVREIRARQSAGRADLAPLIEELERLRRQQPTLSARIALERFLSATGVRELLSGAEPDDD